MDAKSVLVPWHDISVRRELAILPGLVAAAADVRISVAFTLQPLGEVHDGES